MAQVIRPSPWDDAVVAAAERVVNAAIRDFLAEAGSERAIVVTAPAGAGKTRFVGTAVGRARRRRLRVAVSTPTNQQAFALVRRLAVEYPRETITFVPAAAVALPDGIAQLPNVVEVERASHASAATI